ncbi:hypothetical protein ACIBF6_28600 [Streptosporangium amethystogenes]|uniref:hypothetical protein n=1 Tax=Streptosporangium amethystogenes TaxID=2002 RepID=UPI0037B69BA9
MLEPTKKAVLAEAEQLKGRPPFQLVEPELRNAPGASFHNTGPLDFTTLGKDSENVARDLRSYIGAFSPGAVEVLEKYRFDDQITRLEEAGLLYLVTSKFAEIDLRDHEHVPLTSMLPSAAKLKAEIEEYMRHEVLPHAPEAWVNHSKTRYGFEIPFTRYF